MSQKFALVEYVQCGKRVVALLRCQDCRLLLCLPTVVDAAESNARMAQLEFVHEFCNFPVDYYQPCEKT